MYKLLYFAVKFYILNYSDFDKLLLLCISHNLQDCTQKNLTIRASLASRV